MMDISKKSVICPEHGLYTFVLTVVKDRFSFFMRLFEFICFLIEISFYDFFFKIALNGNQ